jgi:Raf kinase inhibitor-like YbhB/YbcL family protein
VARLFALVILVLPVLLAACGSTDVEAPEATAAAEATAAPEVSPEPVAAPAERSGDPVVATTDQPIQAVEVDPKTGFSFNSSSIPTASGTYIGGINTWCEPADVDHVRPGANQSPHVEWSQAPEGTKSFALIAWDPDAPLGSLAFNKVGLSIPRDEPRTDFHHWVLVDIPTTLSALEAGVESDGVPEGDRPPVKTAHGLQGLNDFSKSGPRLGGYAGPCPPWNDELIHRYTFALYALDVKTLGLSGGFFAPDVRAAMEGHVLAQASFTGLFWTNPAIRPEVQ